MLGTGKRALVGTLAGGAWMTWALTTARVVALPVWTTLILAAGFLLISCGYCIVKGTSLRKKHPFPRGPLNRGFLVVLVLEAAGVFGAITAAQKMERFDALPDWIGIVIGLHFFGIAKVFRLPVYYVTAVAITLWCVLSWILFHGDPLSVAAGAGVGAILWATSSYNLVRVLAKVTPE